MKRSTMSFGSPTTEPIEKEVEPNEAETTQPSEVAGDADSDVAADA